MVGVNSNCSPVSSNSSSSSSSSLSSSTSSSSLPLVNTNNDPSIIQNVHPTSLLTHCNANVAQVDDRRPTLDQHVSVDDDNDGDNSIVLPASLPNTAPTPSQQSNADEKNSIIYCLKSANSSLHPGLESYCNTNSSPTSTSQSPVSMTHLVPTTQLLNNTSNLRHLSLMLASIISNFNYQQSSFGQ